MNIFFISCMAMAMLSVLGVLGIGLVSMAKGGDFNKEHGNKIMRARLGLQGLALAMFALAYLTS